jgi:hypothetical protein
MQRWKRIAGPSARVLALSCTSDRSNGRYPGSSSPMGSPPHAASAIFVIQVGRCG